MTISSSPSGEEREFIEDVAPANDAKPAITTVPFPVDKWREITRAGLAIFLTVLLAAVILIVVISVIRGWPVAEAKELLATILSPVVGLVGAATGFYYGGKDRDKG